MRNMCTVVIQPQFVVFRSVIASKVVLMLTFNLYVRMASLVCAFATYLSITSNIFDLSIKLIQV